VRWQLGFIRKNFHVSEDRPAHALAEAGRLRASAASKKTELSASAKSVIPTAAEDHHNRNNDQKGCHTHSRLQNEFLSRIT
jgi:hypothetical protein